MPYTHINFSAFEDDLANRLGDPSKVFWLSPELKLYLTESLRVWNLLTSYHADRGVSITTNASDAFYDLEVELPTLLDYTVTDTELQNQILYHLMETSGALTDQLTQDDITEALQRRLNQFLAETGVVISEVSKVANLDSGRITLDDTVIKLVRVAYRNATSDDVSILWPEDEFTITAGNHRWATNKQTPYAYSVSATPPLVIQIAPVPSSVGTIEMLAIETGPTLDPTTGVILGIPDDLAWVVKWGALADLLSREGEGRDPVRAQFCQSRWELGLVLARIAPTILSAQINGVHTIVEPISSLDAGNATWQNTEGTPNAIASIGDFIALSPVPDGAHSVVLDIVRKMPIPATGTDQVQVGRESIDPILDYAVHLASFKLSGKEWTDTIPTADRFLQSAVRHNSRLSASSANLNAMIEQARELITRYSQDDRGRGTVRNPRELTDAS